MATEMDLGIEVPFEADATTLDDEIRLAQSMSWWQRIIHGEAQEYRVGVLSALSELWPSKRRVRFALCGRGDRVLAGTDGKGFRLMPYGCGERLCPRCSRRGGLRLLHEVDVRFREHGHDKLFHLVLTQRVVPGRSVADTYECLEKKAQKLQRAFKPRGVTAGARVLHCKWSRAGGWHLHWHYVLETREELSEAWLWSLLKGFDDVAEEALFVRQCSPARTPAEVEERCKGLFERADCAGEALGYMVGDVCQGVTALPELDIPSATVGEYAMWAHSVQMCRRFGAWRSKDDGLRDEMLAVQAEDRKERETKEAGWQDFGTVDEVFESAMAEVVLGCLFVDWLYARYRPTGPVGLRLRRVCPPVRKK